jgi:hypothetical protein
MFIIKSLKKKKTYFEIVERPKENFPYYQINAYDNRKTNLAFDDLNFLYQKMGKLSLISVMKIN